MKNYLIIFVLLLVGISCSTINEEENLLSTTPLTKSGENPKTYTFTITSNIDEEIFIAYSILRYLPERTQIEKEAVFRKIYTTTLNEEDGIIGIPFPIPNKKWITAKGDLLSYDVTLDNKNACPYFEAYVDRDINIELIYEDSIPYTGGGNIGGDTGGNTDDTQEDIDKGYYYYSINYGHYSNWNDEYELRFYISSGIFDPDHKYEINPIAGEKDIIIQYQLPGELLKETTLTPQNEYFILKVRAKTSKNPQQIFVTIPDQRHEKLHYILKGTSNIISLY